MLSSGYNINVLGYGSLCKVKKAAHCNPEMYLISVWKDKYIWRYGIFIPPIIFRKAAVYMKMQHIFEREKVYKSM